PPVTYGRFTRPAARSLSCESGGRRFSGASSAGWGACPIRIFFELKDFILLPSKLPFPFFRRARPLNLPHLFLMPRFRFLLWANASAMVINASGEQPSGQIQNSLVRITSTESEPDYRAPWNSGVIGRGVGAGFVISGERILTNAHVVSNSRYLTVER